MSTVYVQRRAGSVVGVFACPQPGLAEEAISDSHADITDFRNPPVPARVQIRALEFDHQAPRFVREYLLVAVAERAIAAGQQPTALPAYVKLKALDDQIAALRRQL